VHVAFFSHERSEFKRGGNGGSEVGAALKAVYRKVRENTQVGGRGGRGGGGYTAVHKNPHFKSSHSSLGVMGVKL